MNSSFPGHAMFPAGDQNDISDNFAVTARRQLPFLLRIGCQLPCNGPGQRRAMAVALLKQTELAHYVVLRLERNLSLFT